MIASESVYGVQYTRYTRDCFRCCSASIATWARHQARERHSSETRVCELTKASAFAITGLLLPLRVPPKLLEPPCWSGGLLAGVVITLGLLLRISLLGGMPAGVVVTLPVQSAIVLHFSVTMAVIIPP